MDTGLSADQIFGLVASLALLIFLLPRVLRLTPGQHRALRLLAGGMVGAALLVAVLLSLAHFAGIG